MYFVTMKRDGYILFALTPSERGALGLTDTQEVHLLTRPSQDAAWAVLARWKGSDYTHTDFMTAWHQRNEPADPAQLLDVLPATLHVTKGSD